MPQRRAILSFSRPDSQPATLPGFEHRAEVRRERKQAEARAIEDSRAYLGTTPTRPRSAQSIFHFSQSDQVVSLVTARENAPDIGFMARLLALCSLPRTNPGTRTQYVRRNGPYTLVMSCTGRARLPYGILPRLVLAWVCSEAVRTQSRVLTLGASLSSFMRKLGIENYSGGKRGDHTRLRHQMDRLFKAAVVLEYENGAESMRVGSLVTDRMHLWWNDREPDTPVLWESTIRLGEDFFNEIVRHPIPLNLNTLKALKRSALGVDLYLWLTYRTFTLTGPLRLPWRQLYRQFAATPAEVERGCMLDNFRGQCVRELKKIGTAWPDLVYRLPYGALVIYPARPRILPGREDSPGTSGGRGSE